MYELNYCLDANRSGGEPDTHSKRWKYEYNLFAMITAMRKQITTGDMRERMPSSLRPVRLSVACCPTLASLGTDVLSSFILSLSTGSRVSRFRISLSSGAFVVSLFTDVLCCCSTSPCGGEWWRLVINDHIDHFNDHFNSISIDHFNSISIDHFN